MPDTIRVRSGRHPAGPHGCGFARTFAVSLMVAGTSSTAGAAALPDWSLIGNYVAALGTLERHELAALALTLGIIFFAVVTAIALVRTRARAASRDAAARADIIALREEVDRANTLLLAEPQIVITWPAAGRSEEHTSELQSRQYLVCRLLLEKKKKINTKKQQHSTD